MTEQACMQTVLSHYLESYKHHHRLSPAQGKVCHRISVCRTEALGGQLVHCDQCDFEQYRYHSCRNRHCPKCQHNASQQWCGQQLQQVFPVNYFHVVFTLPHELNPWVQCHPETLYRCLFQAVWKTIKAFGEDPKRLNGKMGMTAVLHTWGQNLSQHVHLHCLIPGGALSENQNQWHAAKSNYLFPVKALSRHFRGAMVSALRCAYRNGELHRLCSDEIAPCLSQLMQKDWVVHSKAWLKKADTIVRYLGRYTHKIAISDARIKGIHESHVTFDYKDYRDNKDKRMSLDGEEFIRRFLLHVLPEGLMRIRHYGFLSNRTRKQKIETIRACLQVPAQPTHIEETPATEIPQLSDILCPCPKCRTGHLRVCFEIPAKPRYGR
ncbi:MAG: IS91-like element ISSod25 family transposase [Gammaproteobacteria bacterium]|nr:MAG: IS91-like element ISSod25 family transposase [Gammaproteobacteria bacterium]